MISDFISRRWRSTTADKTLQTTHYLYTVYDEVTLDTVSMSIAQTLADLLADGNTWFRIVYFMVENLRFFSLTAVMIYSFGPLLGRSITADDAV